MENITRRKEEKAAAAKQGFTKSSDQISYIGQINNNNNNINNFFIQDASSLLQPSSINEQPKKAPLSAIQLAKAAKRVHSQPQSPKNSLAKEAAVLFNPSNGGENPPPAKSMSNSNFAGFIKEQVKKIKKIQQVGDIPPQSMMQPPEDERGKVRNGMPRAPSPPSQKLYQ